MKRTIPVELNNTCIQYAGDNAKSVVIFLPGIGERGTDVTLMEKNIKVLAAFRDGTLDLPRIVIAQQIPVNVGGYYGNIIGPLLDYAKKFKLPIDFCGLSLGGMGVGLNLPVFPGVFRSAMTCPGKVEADKLADQYGPAINYTDAYRKIPSQHYYDPADLTIYQGYTSTKNLVTKLQAEGKKDITLIELPNSPSNHHDVWDYAYQKENYWSWLDSLEAPYVPKPHLIVDGVDYGVIAATSFSKVEIVLK